MEHTTSRVSHLTSPRDRPWRRRSLALAAALVMALASGSLLLRESRATRVRSMRAESAALSAGWTRSPELKALQESAAVLRAQIRHHLNSESSGAQRVRVAELSATEDIVAQLLQARKTRAELRADMSGAHGETLVGRAEKAPSSASSNAGSTPRAPSYPAPQALAKAPHKATENLKAEQQRQDQQARKVLLIEKHLPLGGKVAKEVIETSDTALDLLAAHFMKHGASMSEPEMRKTLEAWRDNPETILATIDATARADGAPDKKTHNATSGERETVMTEEGSGPIRDARLATMLQQAEEAKGDRGICGQKAKVLSKFDKLLQTLGTEKAAMLAHLQEATLVWKDKAEAWLQVESRGMGGGEGRWGTRRSVASPPPLLWFLGRFFLGEEKKRNLTRLEISLGFRVYC